MRTKSKDLSSHSKQVLKLLSLSKKPLSAYEIMDELRDAGIKAPPTVYRALDALLERNLVHRIESLNAFVSCHNEKGKHDHHSTQFAVCRGCGNVTEIHDHRLCGVIEELGKKLKFRIERKMFELLGLCKTCSSK